jgi:hypothetical protein
VALSSPSTDGFVHQYAGFSRVLKARLGKSAFRLALCLRTRWSPVRGNEQSGTFIAGIWNVTNSSESDVVILKARLSKYQTQFVQISTYDPSVEGFGASYPIHSNQMSEVSADFTFFPSIGRAPKPIISDVIFTDNFRNEHRARTQFSYIGPKPVHEPPLWSRWLRR